MWLLYPCLLFKMIFCNYNYICSFDCTKFKTGKFYYRGDKDGNLYKVVRNDSIQIETVIRTGNYAKFGIVWTGPCEYTLTFKSQHFSLSDSITANFTEKKLFSKITAVGQDSCRIESRFDNDASNEIFKGTLYIDK